MKFEISLKGKTADEITEIKRYLRQGVKVIGESTTTDDTILECESKNISGRPRVLTKEEAAAVKEMYFAGWSAAKIAEHMGCKKRSVYEITTKLSKDKDRLLKDSLITMREWHYSMTEMAKRLNISRQTVSKMLKKMSEEEDNQGGIAH